MDHTVSGALFKKFNARPTSGKPSLRHFVILLFNSSYLIIKISHYRNFKMEKRPVSMLSHCERISLFQTSCISSKLGVLNVLY